jgi:hypothetical protein
LSIPDSGSLFFSYGLSKLDEASMAEFYTWVYRNYAPQDYPILEGWRTWEHEIADFRDAIPRRLAERGTKESVSELERIQQLLGIDMSYQIHLAKRNYLQNTWETLLPSQFRELIQDKRTRWIQSGSQLLDAIIETLNELNLELQGRTGATPAAIDLWNETKIANNDGKREIIQTPFDENRLSDYVERFLKRKLRGRGVFISRENQIRRGSFTDIYVETSPLMPDGSLGQTITVVIEVKGCWHPDLKTAMQAQLQNRYLAENNIYNGIYLVGRFKCDSWNRNGDQSRWERSNRIDDIELQTFLKNQAEVLSAGGYDIRPFILNASLST